MLSQILTLMRQQAPWQEYHADQERCEEGNIKQFKNIKPLTLDHLICHSEMYSTNGTVNSWADIEDESDDEFHDIEGDEASDEDDEDNERISTANNDIKNTPSAQTTNSTTTANNNSTSPQADPEDPEERKRHRKREKNQRRRERQARCLEQWQAQSPKPNVDDENTTKYVKAGNNPNNSDDERGQDENNSDNEARGSTTVDDSITEQVNIRVQKLEKLKTSLLLIVEKRHILKNEELIRRVLSSIITALAEASDEKVQDTQKKVDDLDEAIESIEKDIVELKEQLILKLVKVQTLKEQKEDKIQEKTKEEKKREKLEEQRKRNEMIREHVEKSKEKDMADLKNKLLSLIEELQGEKAQPKEENVQTKEYPQTKKDYVLEEENLKPTIPGIMESSSSSDDYWGNWQNEEHAAEQAEKIKIDNFKEIQRKRNERIREQESTVSKMKEKCLAEQAQEISTKDYSSNEKEKLDTKERENLNLNLKECARLNKKYWCKEREKQTKEWMRNTEEEAFIQKLRMNIEEAAKIQNPTSYNFYDQLLADSNRYTPLEDNIPNSKFKSSSLQSTWASGHHDAAVTAGRSTADTEADSGEAMNALHSYFQEQGLDLNTWSGGDFASSTTANYANYSSGNSSNANVFGSNSGHDIFVSKRNGHDVFSPTRNGHFQRSRHLLYDERS